MIDNSSTIEDDEEVSGSGIGIGVLGLGGGGGDSRGGESGSGGAGREHLPAPRSKEREVMLQRNARTLSSLRVRWAILLLSCVAMTGTYYSYDTPAALHQQIEDAMAPYGDFEVLFNLLYTLYSLPNVVLPFFGGNIVDRLGSARCMLGFALITLLGQFVFALGFAAFRSWKIMLLGRMIYGLGGESVIVATSALLARWFVGKEMALAFGINLAVSRLGSVLNNYVSPAVADAARWGSTGLALFVGVIMNGLAVAAAAQANVVDGRAVRKCDAENRAVALLTASLLEDDYAGGDGGVGGAGGGHGGDIVEEVPDRLDMPESIHVSAASSRAGGGGSSAGGVDEDAASVRLSDVRRFGRMFWLLSLSCVVVYGCVLPFNNVASGLLLERNYFVEAPQDGCFLRHPEQCTAGTLVAEGSNPSTDKDGNPCPGANVAPVLPDSLNVTYATAGGEWSRYDFDPLLPSDIDCGDPFWSRACTANYCAAQDLATEVAGRVMSIPYFLSAALSPPLGFIVDRIGCRAIIASLAPLILIAVHATLAAGRRSPVAPLIFQGVAYSLYAAVIWPSVPLTVEGRLTGTAYGVITSVQNVGLAVFPLIVAALYDAAGGHYLPDVEIFFVSCATVGLVVGGALNYYDARTGGKLNGRSGVVGEQELAVRGLCSRSTSGDGDERVISNLAAEAEYI